jgi:hypothetical protein
MSNNIQLNNFMLTIELFKPTSKNIKKEIIKDKNSPREPK